MFARIAKNSLRFKNLPAFPVLPPQNFSVPVRFFTEKPKKDLDPNTKKIMDELKSGPNEPKKMPALFYGMAMLLIFLMYYLQFIINNPKKPQNNSQTVKILGEAKIGGKWSALNSKGELVTNTDFKDSYVVYYFGFTRCPDICPASMQKLAAAIDLLKEKKVKNVRALFISLDAGRDSPDAVGKYAKLFHDDIEALVVRQEDLTEFLKTFKLYSRKVLNDNDYMLDHTTYMYLFDKNEKFINVIGANLNYEELAEKIEAHIKEIEQS